MTVRENLDMGAYLRRDKRDRARTSTASSSCSRGCKERERQKAGTMSGGEQQMLAIGRALMARPKLLLLDEPSMGIAPILVERIYETIAEINRQGTTILLVEQNANFALGVSQRGYVLETGKVALTDESATLARGPRGAEGVPRRMTIALAVIGATALYLLYVWLASAIVASYLSARKGYGGALGLASGCCSASSASSSWLFVPARERVGLEGPRPVRRRPDRDRGRRPRSAARQPALGQRVAQRLVEVGVRGTCSRARARRRGTIRTPLEDDLAHLAVEELDRERRGPARRRAGAARARAPWRTPCSSPARARRR